MNSLAPRRRPSASIFEEANVKLCSVITDILGVSGRRILRAIVAGETDPAKLSELGGPRLAATPPHLAIRGSMAPARSEPQGLTPSVTPWSQWTSRICFPLIYSRSVPARSGCARCPLASPEPRHDAGQVTHSTVRPAYKHPSATLPSPSAAPGPRSNRYRPSAPLLLHLTRFRPLALFVRLRPARVDGVVMQASENLHRSRPELVQHTCG